MQQKPRLLWLAFKLIDKSENRIVLFEMLKLLNGQFDGRLLAGYRDAPVPAVIAGHAVEYYDRSGCFPINVLRAYFSQRRALRRLFAEAPSDVIFLSHAPSLVVMRAVLSYATHAGTPVVFDVRTLPTTESNSPAFWKFGYRLSFACRHFAGVTYITEEMRRYCIERYRLPKHHSAIWSSGVNAEAFQPPESSLGDVPFRLIYHGGIISLSRGLDQLIQAMDRVRDLDVHLTLMSSLREPEAIAWIDRLNLRDRVTLVDTIPHAEVPAVIQCNHVGILPFPSCDVWNTSSPIKLFEYLSCGKPVIVTEIPAHRNVLEGKPFAFFAKDATSEALADAIRRAYANRSRWQQLGALARQQVLKNHTWARQAEILSEFLKEMIQ